LNKAKDKLLFLAFCVEFKRFFNFYMDENQTEFKSYLPIQLDATCNGFQHMSLLSNEKQLFRELNLIGGDYNQPPTRLL
jgi:DNA-directed RNA polymerase